MQEKQQKTSSALILLKPLTWTGRKMFKMNSPSKLMGPGYLVLNVLRVLNIITLLMVAVASWVMLVMTVKTSNFYFFDGFRNFARSALAVFLIVSESSWFKTWFEELWPTLSYQHGLSFIGGLMIWLGFDVLANLNQTATSIDNLGLPLWRLVIAAGILVSIIGLFNIIGTFIFCDSSRNLTGRHVRSYGAAPPADKLEKTFSFGSRSTSRRSSLPAPVLPTYNAERQERKSRFSFRLPIRPFQISKPIHQDSAPTADWTEHHIPEIPRPPSALHPYHKTNPAPPPSSRYSEYNGSEFTRF